MKEATFELCVHVQEANWELYKRQKEAEGLLYEQEKLAEGRRATSEAARFARQNEAEAELYAKKKEAEGLVAMTQAQKLYIASLLGALDGDYSALRDYLMINGGTYQDMARLNAEAVRGLQPNITVWTNGSGDGAEGGGAMKEMAGVYRMLPPLLKTVQEQTGIERPTWMARMTETAVV
ncbi:hypothetical protein ZIOFF_028508 [Zingiber officinale]|uniref:Flotillin-like n=1 Tax=Zingiber officinale TaxID=94328 RepID=A0A8J5GZR3_ZINOF|nr:hypothetical protein ZIOFF_028508 [Zingiber officinale]